MGIMPFITSDKINVASHALVGVENKGDKKLFHHIQNITPTLEMCSEMRNADGNGWSKEKTRRHVGSIPEMIFLQHPEWTQDPRLITKWLKTEEGKMFATVGGGI